MINLTFNLNFIYQRKVSDIKVKGVLEFDKEWKPNEFEFIKEEMLLPQKIVKT